MEDLKSQIIDKFTNEINSLDLSMNETALTLKYNSIVENILNTIIVKKEKINIPLHQTTNDNNLEHTFDNTFGLCAGKSADTVISSNSIPRISTNTSSNFTIALSRSPVVSSIPYEKGEPVFSILNSGIFTDITLFTFTSRSTLALGTMKAVLSAADEVIPLARAYESKAEPSLSSTDSRKALVSKITVMNFILIISNV